jgi:two-component system, LytTR family, response regulator
MTNPSLIPVTFRIPKNWKLLLAGTLGGILLFQLMTLYRQSGSEFSSLFRGDIGHYFKTLFGYYLLFELVSVFIFIQVAHYYIQIFRMTHLVPTLKGVLLYELNFLPCVLAAIVIFGPITNGLRYLAVFYPDYSWAVYFPEYFFTARMFGNYFLPFLIFGYIYLNVNLFLNYNEWQKTQLMPPHQPVVFSSSYLTTLDAWFEHGETILSVNDVLYFEVEQKSYFAYTKGRTFNIKKTLSELEAELNPQHFFRVNRSVIVNLHFLKNYSYWENDKYIVRLSDGKTEFVMQRPRVKELKERLGARDEQ